MAEYCPDPKFPYNEVQGWYEACSTCGQSAWQHNGSQPLEDLKNTIGQLFSANPFDLPPRPLPPVVRPG